MRYAERSYRHEDIKKEPALQVLSLFCRSAPFSAGLVFYNFSSFSNRSKVVQLSFSSGDAVCRYCEHEKTEEVLLFSGLLMG